MRGSRKQRLKQLEEIKATYSETLKEMTDQQLYEEAKKYIWLSAYAANNPLSEYHVKCDATYTESARRDPKAPIYDRAHKAVTKDCGY